MITRSNTLVTVKRMAAVAQFTKSNFERDLISGSKGTKIALRIYAHLGAISGRLDQLRVLIA